MKLMESTEKKKKEPKKKKSPTKKKRTFEELSAAAKKAVQTRRERDPSWGAKGEERKKFREQREKMQRIFDTLQEWAKSKGQRQKFAQELLEV